MSARTPRGRTLALVAAVGVVAVAAVAAARWGAIASWSAWLANRVSVESLRRTAAGGVVS